MESKHDVTLSVTKCSKKSQLKDAEEDNESSCVLLEPVIGQIINFMPTAKDKCSLRTVNRTFDFMVKQRVYFHAILADFTRTAFLSLQWNHQISELRVKDLYRVLPCNAAGELECEFDRHNIRLVWFYPGVPTKNKNILLSSFPFIKELAFIGTSDFPTSINAEYFQNLKKLEMFVDTLNDTGSLLEFLGNSKFPNLKETILDFYVRTNFPVYLAAHEFVSNHRKTLKSLTLKYSAKCNYVLPESVTYNMSGFSMLVVKQLKDLIATLDELCLDNLSIDFLPFEGTSLFDLSFSLARSQANLISLCLRKDYTCARHELLPLPTILMQNYSTLEAAHLPHPYHMDCRWIEKCASLKTLSIGQKSFRAFQMTFAESVVLNISSLPTQIQKFMSSIRLSREQINFIVTRLTLTEFFFYGHQTDKYTCEDIQFILHRQHKIEYLGCNVDMDVEDFSLLVEYLDSTNGVSAQDVIYGVEELYVALGASRVKLEVLIDNNLFRRTV